MRKIELYLLLTMLVLVFFFGCRVSFFVSFNGGSSTLFVRVTDARPSLPHGVEAVFITFEEFFVHSEAGDWISLELVNSPYAIDLLELHSGNTSHLVKPAKLEASKYDKIRASVSSVAVLSGGVFYSVALPSGSLSIEREFHFELKGGKTLDLTIDFDLSQSLSISGPPPTHSYKLEPVLHINPTKEAASIRGEIAAGTFGEYKSVEAMVTIFLDKDLSGDLSEADEEYTRIIVDVENPDFEVFWLVPEQGYIVQVEMDGAEPREFEQFVFPADLQKGNTFQLNHGYPI
ncbi:MAG: DUF4382 domain-containing protein [Deltaproteobacteria bacterium]|nr:MAG: DUF4382 domain-containing protein [Deltaproteobacteria bacterium]